MFAPPSGAVLSGFLLELAAVAQHERGQLDRPCRGVDRAAIARLHEARQQTAVIEVGMGQDDRVEGVGREREIEPVVDHLVRAALEHPAIDQDPCAHRLDQEL